MARSKRNRLLSPARVHRAVTGLYSSIPYRFFKGGYAFPPLHYFFEVTRRCNLRCKMCQYIHWLQGTPAARQREGELSTEEWRAIIDQTHRFSVITFTGGEPWVREDFAELLGYASAKRRTHYITNATRLTDENARCSAELAPKGTGGKGLNFVGVSLHGTREVHDSIANYERAFELALEGVRALTRHRDALGKGCPVIHVTTVVQETNLDALPEMPALVADAGADMLNVTMEVRLHDVQGLPRRDLCSVDDGEVVTPKLDKERLDPILNATEAAAARVGLELRLPDMPRDAVLDYYSGGLDLGQFDCRTAWTSLMVGAKGGVCPCFIHEAGQVREQDLKTIWNGAKMRWFRKHMQAGPFNVCQGCCNLRYTGGCGHDGDA